ncbi:MAG TPA: DUF6152 family protein [Vicinamibacterales bacterium]
MWKSVLFGVCLGFLVLAATARAHHGDAGRYIEDVITITGSVVELQMTNPHAHIVFDAPDPNANDKVVRWQAELGGPQQLIKNFGWSPSTVKPGMKIQLTGRRLKSGAPYINLTERANIVVLETGKEIWRTGNYGQPAPPPGESGTSGQPAPPAR